MSTTGEKLKAVRLQKGWSQARVAKALDEKYTTSVSRWETGRARPNTRQLERLSEVFGCELKELMGSDGAANPAKMDESEKIRALNESIVKKNLRIQELEAKVKELEARCKDSEDQALELMLAAEDLKNKLEKADSSKVKRLKEENDQLKKLMFEKWLKEELGKQLKSA